MCSQIPTLSSSFETLENKKKMALSKKDICSFFHKVNGISDNIRWNL